MPPDLVPVVVEVDVFAALSKDAGPVAAIALLVLAAARTDEGGAVSANVRDLAVQIGVSKDTAARAINRLISCGVLARSAAAHDDAGRFCPRGYRVDLAAAGFRAVDLPTLALAARPTIVPDKQPSLFDD